MSTVTDILDFEAEHAQQRPTNTEVRQRFGWTLARYYQLLAAVVTSEAALQHDPVTTGRLQRILARNQASRSSITPGTGT